VPWKDQELVQKISQDYSLTPKPIVALQLYYEFAFFEIPKHDRILKTIPLLIRMLVDDLISCRKSD